MPIPALVGHGQIKARLAQAVRNKRLPQVLLFTGEAGVGKQRLALWLAQLAVCERDNLEPCRTCRRCRLVESLSYADLHWFVPIPRPKAGDPDKQVDEAAEVLAEIMEERRSGAPWSAPDGMASHSMASVRLLQRRASLTPVEGGARIFIIGDADRLVPQEANPEAANALLKLLEEPPAGSIFVLTTVDPRRVLPTIRSRAVPVRLTRLSDAEVREFLWRHSRPPLAGETLEARVALAEGAIGRALAADDVAGDAYRSARELLEAVVKGPGPVLERALRQPPYQARGEFAAMLDALADTIGEAARGSLGQPMRRPVPDALLRHGSPAPLLRALERVGQAREAAAGNVNPQLLLAVLGEELAEVL
jgi:DNA polymerase III subunit delta'